MRSKQFILNLTNIFMFLQSIMQLRFLFTINIIRLPRSAYGNETNILEFKSNIPKDAGDDSWIPTFETLEENITQPTQ